MKNEIENENFLLLNNDLYILIKRDFKKKGRKEKGKRKEGKNKSSLTDPIKFVKVSRGYAVNMREIILNVFNSLGQLYNEL